MNANLAMLMINVCCDYTELGLFIRTHARELYVAVGRFAASVTKRAQSRNTSNIAASGAVVCVSITQDSELRDSTDYVCFGDAMTNAIT